ncbi:MAG TPA: hypothetical protein VGM51_06235 [Armatimonadota bacterium]|jgi:hypothetical protein
MKAVIGTLGGAALGYLVILNGMYYIYRAFRPNGVASEEPIFFLITALGGILLGAVTGLTCGLSWGGYARTAARTCLICSTMLFGWVSLLFIQADLPPAAKLGQGLELLRIDRFGLLFVWNAVLLLWGVWWRMRTLREDS